MCKTELPHLGREVAVVWASALRPRRHRRRRNCCRRRTGHVTTGRAGRGLSSRGLRRGAAKVGVAAASVRRLGLWATCRRGRLLLMPRGGR